MCYGAGNWSDVLRLFVVVAVGCDGGKLGLCMFVVQCNVVIAGITCAVVVVDADVVIGRIGNDSVDVVVTGQAVG